MWRHTGKQAAAHVWQVSMYVHVQTYTHIGTQRYKYTYVYESIYKIWWGTHKDKRPRWINRLAPLTPKFMSQSWKHWLRVLAKTHTVLGQESHPRISCRAYLVGTRSRRIRHRTRRSIWMNAVRCSVLQCVAVCCSVLLGKSPKNKLPRISGRYKIEKNSSEFLQLACMVQFLRNKIQYNYCLTK